MKKMKYQKEQEEHHEFLYTVPFNMLIISKKEIITSSDKLLTFYLDMKENNKIEFESTIKDMICLKNKLIALSFDRNIKILKKMSNQKYEVYKSVETQSFFLLNIEHLLYSFTDSSMHLINLDNCSLISSMKLNKTKNECLSEKMKPFLLKIDNKYNICIRKGYNLYLLNSKTYKEINHLSFDEAIEFYVTQKANDKFYVCILNNWSFKDNIIDITIKEYNNKFQNINEYNKNLHIPPIAESLYPCHICIYDLLIIKNEFYIFMHSYTEFERTDYENNYLINFENDTSKSIFYRDRGDYDSSKGLNSKILLDDNNKLIFGYSYGYESNSSQDLKIIDYENMDIDSEIYDDDNDEDIDENSEREEEEMIDDDDEENIDEISDNKNDEEEKEKQEIDVDNDEKSEENKKMKKNNRNSKKLKNLKDNTKILGKRTRRKKNN